MHSGDEIRNPITGDRIVFLQTAADTDGELFDAERFMAPGGPVQPEHVHPLQESVIVVLDGLACLKIDGVERLAVRGDRIVIPAGVPHQVCNASDDELHFRFEYRPALESTERFLVTLFGLPHDGRAARDGTPSMLQLAAMLPEYSDYIELTAPPPQKALLSALAPVARLRGFRPSYDQHAALSA